MSLSGETFNDKNPHQARCAVYDPDVKEKLTYVNCYNCGENYFHAETYDNRYEICPTCCEFYNDFTCDECGKKWENGAKLYTTTLVSSTRGFTRCNDCAKHDTNFNYPAPLIITKCKPIVYINNLCL